MKIHEPQDRPSNLDHLTGSDLKVSLQGAETPRHPLGHELPHAWHRINWNFMSLPPN